MTAIRCVLRVLAVVACLVVAWWSALAIFAIPPYLMPTPPEVALAFWTDGALLASMGWTTLSATLVGLFIATLGASAIAALFVQSRALAQATMPLLIVVRSTPVAAIAPLMMLILGRGMETSVFVVVLVSFFPILINMMRGLTAADAQSFELLHVYGASRWQVIHMLRAPTSLPYLFTGLRIAGATAILGALLSEWITGNRGLGLLILESAEMREIDVLWAGICVSIMIALSLFTLTSAAERAVLHWKT
ncbi:ABC transporter permease subunit [Acuticoccus sp. M5D2P5]|uniref:ABC transporter permease n=1 Tax=Acuticoccus kalidii TaxID=2910977 RepID=UPI001F39B2ED|nr:ABC transporter permease subunit [Acuticoccus kalidii]MCF3932948.1 ABC transporter permease subunit [Acuticoccus kalidii]